LIDEKLSERAEYLGQIFRKELRAMPSDLINTVRGKGLLNALVINPRKGINGSFLFPFFVFKIFNNAFFPPFSDSKLNLL